VGEDTLTCGTSRRSCGWSRAGSPIAASRANR